MTLSSDAGVLDACAMVAFLRAEPGGEVVKAHLDDPNRICFAHALNVCEVYYRLLREKGENAARAGLTTLVGLGLEVRDDWDMEFLQEAGRLKVSPGRLSICDCFCIALARRLGCEVVTSDHAEFDPLVPLGICPIRFIR